MNYTQRDKTDYFFYLEMQCSATFLNIRRRHLTQCWSLRIEQEPVVHVHRDHRQLVLKSLMSEIRRTTDSHKVNCFITTKIAWLDFSYIIFKIGYSTYFCLYKYHYQSKQKKELGNITFRIYYFQILNFKFLMVKCDQGGRTWW